VQPEEITSDDFRAEIVKSGCCGHSELIKFCAYKLTEYDFVMHLDIDTLLFGPVLSQSQHLCNTSVNTFAKFW
jgi:hydroxymethylpyrimidine/phosphomethylpyrimidine kinase